MKTLSAIVALLGCGLNLWAQATQVSQIGGTVQDSSDFDIPDAQVEITNTDTGIARKAETGADGAYIVSNLSPGPYRLEVTKSGFSPSVQSSIVLQVNTNPQINVTLKVGTISEQVEVQANASMVESHSNGIGQVIDQARVMELPWNGRQVTQLVTLSGGAADFVPTSAGQPLLSNKNYPTAVAFSVPVGKEDRRCSCWTAVTTWTRSRMSACRCRSQTPSRNSRSRPVRCLQTTARNRAELST